MSSPPHQETAASSAWAAQCLDFRGQWEKGCLPASLCEEPVPAEPTQNSHHAPRRGCSITACPGPLRLPSFAPNAVQTSFKSQTQEDAQVSTFYLSTESCSSLFCSLRNSSQPLNLSSHQFAFKKYQPNTPPSSSGKAGRSRCQLPQGTTRHNKLRQATNRNPSFHSLTVLVH